MTPLLLLLAAATPEPARHPSAAPVAVALTRVRTKEPVVALTFDACATGHAAYGFDRDVFDILKREKVAATVFVSGRWVQKHPTEARELAAEPLIEFGNHSWDHPPFSRLTHAKARAEIGDTERVIAALGRQSVGFRPPFGDWAGWLPRQTGGLPVVLWDVVSGDAGGHVRPSVMVDVVTKSAQPGSIIIFHINGRGPYTKHALPEIIRRLRDRGLRFVPVSELLKLPDAAVIPARPARYHKRGTPAPGSQGG